MNCKNCGYGLKQRCGDFEKIICTYEEGECVKITELEKENAELKYQLNKNPCVKIPDWHCSDCLKENAELKEQNTNLQEMLKTERSVTCKEEYLKKVTELEKENAELKEKYVQNICDCDIYDTYCNSQLSKAKEIIKMVIDSYNHKERFSFEKDLMKAEQFLSEVEK